MASITKQPITFHNHNEALLVLPAANDKPEDVVSALDIQSYKAVILVLGGADSVDEKLVPWLTQLFSRGVARAAAEASAVIMGGGTQSGIMKLMGEGVASRGYKSPLVGVAPACLVAYPGKETEGTQLEPNHSHFVLVEGESWGSETSMMYGLAKALINKPRVSSVSDSKFRRQEEKILGKVPAIAILAGGGDITRDEMLRAVRHNLPIIIVQGSGGLADEIAAASENKDGLPDDPVMAEIIADGELHFHPLKNSVKGIERLIIRELGIDKVLMQAWETFADYDHNADLQQKRFDKLQLAIIFIGILGTTLVILQQLYAPKEGAGSELAMVTFKQHPGWWLLYHVMILIPIVVTVLVTASNRFKQGSKWLLLRAGAESIKREIFRYRARAMYYTKNAEQILSQKVEAITQRTMRTEVNSSSLVPYDKDKGFPPDSLSVRGGDDGFSYLTPDRYVEIRLADQLHFYKRKAVKLEMRLKGLYWLTFIIGGLGTYLAAINKQVWIALTTSVVAAIGTFLGYRQTESTLTKCNQAATDLSNVKAWWNALSAEEQARQVNIDSLVEHTEQVLQSELDGWIQQMQNALAELRKEQEPVEGGKDQKEKKEPVERAIGAAGEPAVSIDGAEPMQELNGTEQPQPVNGSEPLQESGPQLITVSGSEEEDQDPEADDDDGEGEPEGEDATVTVTGQEGNGVDKKS